MGSREFYPLGHQESPKKGLLLSLFSDGKIPSLGLGTTCSSSGSRSSFPSNVPVKGGCGGEAQTLGSFSAQTGVPWGATGPLLPTASEDSGTFSEACDEPR